MCLKIKIQDIYLGFFIFLMMLSSSTYIEETGVSSIVLYSGLFIFMANAWMRLLRQKKERLKQICFVLLIVAILSVGILMQGLRTTKKIELICSYFIMASMVIIGKYVVTSFDKLRIMSYSIFIAFLVGIGISIITDTPLMTTTTEGILSIAFTGGMGHKNTIAINLTAGFIGLFLANKFGSKRKNDRVLLMIYLFFILLSASRTSWLLLLIFMVVINFEVIRKVKRKNWIAFMLIVFVVGLVMAAIVINNYVMESENYLLRFKGMLAYFELHRSDVYHMVLGNSEIVYDDRGTYFYNVWRLTGGIGTFEIGYLTIIAKGGFVALFGYIVIILNFFKRIIMSENLGQKIAISAILLPLIASGFVEQFIGNISTCYTAFCWCSLSGISGLSIREERSNEHLFEKMGEKSMYRNMDLFEGK